MKSKLFHRSLDQIFFLKEQKIALDVVQHCNVEEIPQIRFRSKPGEFIDARSCNFRASNVMHIFTAGFPVLAIMIMVVIMFILTIMLYAHHYIHMCTYIHMYI